MPGVQVGLGEGLAPSSATSVMARQIPECAPCRKTHLHYPLLLVCGLSNTTMSGMQV